MSKKLTRRDFVNNSATAAAGLAVFGTLAACDKQGGEEAAPAKAEPKELDCTDVSALSEAEKKTRESLGYVDKSPHPAKLCANCNLFQASGEGCGGCTVIKGPIHPNGYCNSWIQKTG